MIQLFLAVKEERKKSMFPDFIKHYDTIRSILRDVFLYGCFSKNDLGNKNKSSSRKVSYEMKRIKQYIENDFIKIDKSGKNKLLNLSYDSISNTKNFLVSTYFSKSFTKSDLVIYYCILMVLNYEDKPMTLSEIEDVLSAKELINYDEISSKTIERKLKEICDIMEIVSSQKRGRAKEYSIADDILKDLSNEEIKRFFIILDLYKNIIFPHISGYYFYDTLKDYMTFERKIDYKENNYFQYNYLHFQSVIEEELVLKVMKAIENKKMIKVINDDNHIRYKRKSKDILKPIKLRYDVECGRFYVIGFYDERCISVRLDRTDDIEILKENFEYNIYLEKYKESMEKSFSAVPINSKNIYNNVKLELIINNPEEEYLVEKIKGELGNCSFKMIGDNRYIIEKEVNDGHEMIPWIRKYGGNIKVIEPAALSRRLKKDWEDMLKNYGIV